jgi:hypothetical protein
MEQSLVFFFFCTYEDSDTTVASYSTSLRSVTVVFAGHGGTVCSDPSKEDYPTMSPTGTSAVPDKHIVIVVAMHSTFLADAQLCTEMWK